MATDAQDERGSSLTIFVGSTFKRFSVFDFLF